MLPKNLTPEQNAIPDLTESQLKRLGFSSNKVWKLNAKMLGFKPSNENDIEDFIDEKIGVKIKTYKKGKQIVLFRFCGTKDHLDSYPIAFEGDVIISEKWEFDDGHWENLELFQVDRTQKLIRCAIVPFNLTGNFELIYGKLLGRAASRPQGAETSATALHKSLENISSNLKEINAQNREMQFIEKNFSVGDSKCFRIIKG